MVKLLWISIMTILVTAAISITNTALFSNTYGCINSTNTNHTNSSSVVNGNSSVSAKPSAFSSQDQISTLTIQLVKMPTLPGTHDCGCFC